MMILGKPEQRMSRVARQKLRDDSQAVNIGNDSGRHDKDFFSPADPHGSSEKPSCQKMRNWTHYLEKPPVCPVSLVCPRQSSRPHNSIFRQNCRWNTYTRVGS